MGYLSALVGGMLIGLAGCLFLLFDGKILGVSGLLGACLEKRRDRVPYLILAGLLTGGVLLFYFAPSSFGFPLDRSPARLIVAGLLVGFGTRLGSGCTSGHGVCGISRLSRRSIVATLTFMALGILTVFIVRMVAWRG